MTSQRRNLLLALSSLALAFVACESYNSITEPTAMRSSTRGQSAAAAIATPTPSCADGKRNGTETDIDCGGGSCATCSNSKLCRTGTDCTSGFCSKLGRCRKPPSPTPTKTPTPTPTPACPGGCDDSNACTTDTCDPVLGCVYTAVTCNDSSACTTDTCDTSTGCVFTAITCNDANACTTDSCDASSGCVATPVVCNDGDACTTDSCDTTLGCQTTAVSCDDVNECTTDSCDSMSGCGNAPVMDGTPCTGGTCTAGVCVLDLCSNGVKDGVETDVDCGGGTCPDCASGKLCKVGTDCVSNICTLAGFCF